MDNFWTQIIADVVYKKWKHHGAEKKETGDGGALIVIHTERPITVAPIREACVTGAAEGALLVRAGRVRVTVVSLVITLVDVVTHRPVTARVAVARVARTETTAVCVGAGGVRVTAPVVRVTLIDISAHRPVAVHVDVPVVAEANKGAVAVYTRGVCVTVICTKRALI